MEQLNHENVIKLYEKSESSNNFYLIMDFINGGSLADFLSDYKLKQGTAFPQKIIQHFVKQIVNGLVYIHSKNIIHRDLKLDNILLQFPSKIEKKLDNYIYAQVKIIDFGLSFQIDKKDLATSFVGTPIYMDPIILEKYEKAGGVEKFKKYECRF